MADFKAIGDLVCNLYKQTVENVSPDSEFPKHSGTNTARADEMRENMPLSERLFWQQIRDGQIFGLAFFPQVCIEGIIADFYCPSLKLLVEIDGPEHDRDHDERRDLFLARRGFRTIRLSAHLSRDRPELAAWDLKVRIQKLFPNRPDFNPYA